MKLSPEDTRPKMLSHSMKHSLIHYTYTGLLREFARMPGCDPQDLQTDWVGLIHRYFLLSP